MTTQPKFVLSHALNNPLSPTNKEPVSKPVTSTLWPVHLATACIHFYAWTISYSSQIKDRSVPVWNDHIWWEHGQRQAHSTPPTPQGATILKLNEAYDTRKMATASVLIKNIIHKRGGEREGETLCCNLLSFPVYICRLIIFFPYFPFHSPLFCWNAEPGFPLARGSV